MREVVVVLLFDAEHKILMQLRDDKKGVVWPGFWGFFGGSLDEGETPEEAVKREMLEELGYQPEVVQKLHVDRIADLENLISHSYYGRLNVPLEDMVLREGMDLGLFSREEIMSKELYSARMKKSFPVVPITYVVDSIDRLQCRLTGSNHEAVDGFGRVRP